MSDTSQIALIRKLYDAMGDVNAFKSLLADDVEWDIAEGFPNGGVYRGYPDDQANRFNPSAMRVTALNALTASIAHEINQPLAGIITNASTCLRMLSADPPNLDGARETARRALRDGNRASDVITRLRELYGKKEFTFEPVDLNEATREVIALSLGDLQRNRVVLRSQLAEDLPPVTGDRVQLQQVVLNMVRNGSDAMVGIEDRPRELWVKTELEKGNHVRLSVIDAGVGFRPEVAGKLFEPFYTTKADGMGIGLSVSRSIIEAHHGRLWGRPNEGPGAEFSFSIPCVEPTIG
jgi:C4-dicarboxylate-specific signal transduction histidine kinase